MRWKQIALWILAMACVTGQAAAADGPTNTPMFQQWITRYIKFSLVGGRVIGNPYNGAWVFGMPKQVLSDGPVHQQVDLKGNGVSGSLAYSYQRNSVPADERNDPRVAFGVDIGSEGRFVLRYSDKDQPEKYFHFRQVPGQPVSLSLPPSGKPRVLRAPTIWHLLIIYPDDCRQQFAPTLESLRPGWHVGLAAQSVEEELVKMAAVSRKPDRKQWEAWVNQLGDPQHWTSREKADRNLREVGPAVLGYLNRLNMSQFDAEQKSRLRRIIRFLSTQTGEDTPEHVAAMIIEDPLVWLALLARPDESTRQAAVQQLTVLLNSPVAVDPKAEPDSQAKARDELQARIEKIVGDSSKIDDGPGN